MTNGESISLGRLADPRNPTDEEVTRAMLMVSVTLTRTWTAERLTGGWLFGTPRGPVISALAFPDAVCEATGHSVNYLKGTAA